MLLTRTYSMSRCWRQRITFEMIAGGLVVIKSNVSPLTPIPSLSIKNMGRLVQGGVTSLFTFSERVEAQSKAGIRVDISAPVVVVPTVSEPTYQ